MIYLDNAATTYPKPEEVLRTLDQANRTAFNTGRGSYKPARKLTSIVDTVREKIKKLNNIVDGETIFTPSATQALNDIIFGIDVDDDGPVGFFLDQLFELLGALAEKAAVSGIGVSQGQMNGLGPGVGLAGIGCVIRAAVGAAGSHGQRQRTCQKNAQ